MCPAPRNSAEWASKGSKEPGKERGPEGGSAWPLGVPRPPAQGWGPRVGAVFPPCPGCPAAWPRAPPPSWRTWPCAPPPPAAAPPGAPPPSWPRQGPSPRRPRASCPCPWWPLGARERVREGSPSGDGTAATPHRVGSGIFRAESEAWPWCVPAGGRGLRAVCKGSSVRGCARAPAGAARCLLWAPALRRKDWPRARPGRSGAAGRPRLFLAHELLIRGQQRTPPRAPPVPRPTGHCRVITASERQARGQRGPFGGSREHGGPAGPGAEASGSAEGPALRVVPSAWSSQPRGATPRTRTRTPARPVLPGDEPCSRGSSRHPASLPPPLPLVLSGASGDTAHAGRVHICTGTRRSTRVPATRLRGWMRPPPPLRACLRGAHRACLRGAHRALRGGPAFQARILHFQVLGTTVRLGPWRGPRAGQGAGDAKRCFCWVLRRDAPRCALRGSLGRPPAAGGTTTTFWLSPGPWGPSDCPEPPWVVAGGQGRASLPPLSREHGWLGQGHRSGQTEGQFSATSATFCKADFGSMTEGELGHRVAYPLASQSPRETRPAPVCVPPAAAHVSGRCAGEAGTNPTIPAAAATSPRPPACRCPRRLRKLRRTSQFTLMRRQGPVALPLQSAGV